MCEFEFIFIVLMTYINGIGIWHIIIMGYCTRRGGLSMKQANRNIRLYMEKSGAIILFEWHGVQ